MRGGQRPGAGRPKGTHIDPKRKREMIHTRIPQYLIDRLEQVTILTGQAPGRTIERALIQFFHLETATED